MYFFSLGWRWECMTQPTGYQRFHQTEEMMVQLCLGTESTFQAAYYWIRLVRYVLECFTQFCRYHSWFFSRKMWAVKTNLQLFRIIVRNWLYSILCILSTMGIVIVLDENLCFHQRVAPKAQSLNWEVPGKSHSILSFFKSNINTIMICAGLANPQQARLWWRLWVWRDVWEHDTAWTLTCDKASFSDVLDNQRLWYVVIYQCVFGWMFIPFFILPILPKIWRSKTRWHLFSWQNTRSP